MVTKKKILVVAESIDVEDSSGSKANVALILNLKDAGFEMKIYHYTRKDIQLPGITCISVKEKKINVLYLFSRIQRKIQHFFDVNLAKFLEPVFGFSFTFFNDTKSITVALRKEKEFIPDLIFTLSKGASFRPHYALLKLPELHHKWLAYIHDPYPFHHYPVPFKWDEPGYKQKVRFFKELSEKCKWASFPSLLLKEWMQNFYPAFKDKSLIIPHQLLTKQQIKLPTHSYFQNDKFVLLHAGNLLKQRSPVPLIKAYESFLKSNPDAEVKSQLILLGGASDHKEEIDFYNGKIEQLYCSNGYVKYQDVQLMQERASVNIIIESTADESPFLPGKFPHCIAAKKPILLLGPPLSESRRLLGSDYPFWAEADNVEAISLLIENLFQTWLKKGELNFDRPDLEFYLSKERLSQELEKILE